MIQAAGGNPALLDLLTQIAETTAQAQAATGTTPVAGSQETQSATAPVPPQARGYVSEVTGVYTVQIVNPGASSPLSQLQSAAQGYTAPQPTKPIFHQVRASTSPAFNVNSNTQTFGGDTGSTQTLFTLNGLGAGTWYFQFRSSFDGVNFNTWKNANGGTALGGLVNQVTELSAAFSEWAIFSLPGDQTMGIGEGLLADSEVMGIPPGYNLYSSGLLGLAGPNGFPAQGNGVSGMTLSDVEIENGSGAAPAGQIPDYPVLIRSQMAQASTTNVLPSNASVLAFAFNPTSKNVKLFPGASGTVWARFRLPGGARFAIGAGKNLDGTEIWTPPSETWMSAARMISICSLTDTPLDQPPITGFGECQLSGFTAQGRYMLDDGSLTSPGVQNVNWLAICWEQGAPVRAIGTGKFLTIQLQGDHSVVIGAGQSASGAAISLPAGYTADQMLGLVTPGGSDNSGRHLRGVLTCAFSGLMPILTYTDNVNYWSGTTNWMVAAWK